MKLTKEAETIIERIFKIAEKTVPLSTLEALMLFSKEALSEDSKILAQLGVKDVKNIDEETCNLVCQTIVDEYRKKESQECK